MSQSGPKQTKKQKKALAFRTRQKTGKKNKDLDDEDASSFPIDEIQDLGEGASLPLEAAENSAVGKSGNRKGKAEDGGQRQVQSSRSKKRKREGEEVVEGQPQKKTKLQSAVLESSIEDGNVEETMKAKKNVQPQRFILFIGAFPVPSRV